MANIIDNVAIRIDADTTLFDRKLQNIKDEFKKIQRIQVDINKNTTGGKGVGSLGSGLAGGLAGGIAGGVAASGAGGSTSNITNVIQQTKTLKQETDKLTSAESLRNSGLQRINELINKYRKMVDLTVLSEKQKLEIMQQSVTAYSELKGSVRAYREELEKLSVIGKTGLKNLLNNIDGLLKKGELLKTSDPFATYEYSLNVAVKLTNGLIKAKKILKKVALSTYKVMSAGLKRVSSAIASTGKSMLSSMANAFKKIRLLALAAFAAIIALAKRGFTEGMVDKRALANLDSALASTGAVIGVTTEKARELIDALDKETNFGKAELANASAILATFTNIKGDKYEEVLETVTDLSAAFGQDLKSSAVQLGKALNDPITGVTALSRVGVSFTEQEKEKIKTLMEENKILEAQSLILNSLKTQGISGQARAMSDSVTQTKKGFEDFRKELATFAVKFFRLKDVFDNGRQWFDALSARIRAFTKTATFAKWSQQTIYAIKSTWNFLYAFGKNLAMAIKYWADVLGVFFDWFEQKLFSFQTAQEFVIWLSGGEEALQSFIEKQQKLRAELNKGIRPFEDINLSGIIPTIQNDLTDSFETATDAIDDTTSSIQELKNTISQGTGATSIFDSVLEGINSLRGGSGSLAIRKTGEQWSRIAKYFNGGIAGGASTSINSSTGGSSQASISTQIVNAIQSQTDILVSSLNTINSSVRGLSTSPVL